MLDNLINNTLHICTDAFTFSPQNLMKMTEQNYYWRPELLYNLAAKMIWRKFGRKTCVICLVNMNIKRGHRNAHSNRRTLRRSQNSEQS